MPLTEFSMSIQFFHIVMKHDPCEPLVITALCGCADECMCVHSHVSHM